MNNNLFQTNFNKRLNDYDLNILNDNSFKDLDDKTLKLECLIAEKEEALDALNTKIKGAELLGKLLDVMDLKIRAKQIENELVQLKEEYSKRNITEKLTDVITPKKQKPKLSPIHRLARFVSRKIIARMSKKFKSILDLSDSLDTLESINENQYTKVKDLSKKYNTKLEVVDAYSNTYSIWKVYEQSDAGSEVVDAVPVTHVEDFLTQEDAVEFAAKKNIQAVIKQVGVTEKSYNIKLCCTNIDNAKKIANGSKITDKVIKIIRQK